MSSQRRLHKGFTLVELMITLVVAAIILALAVPSYRLFIEKRRLTAAAEEIVNFIAVGRQYSVKTNDYVTFKWSSLDENGQQSGDSSHPDGWCLGMFQHGTFPNKSEDDVDEGCDCRVTNPASSGACLVDGQLYQLTQTDFVNISSEFMDLKKARGRFTFDPIRGNIIEYSDGLFNEDPDGSNDTRSTIFEVHSSEETEVNGKRLFELRLRLMLTGQVKICADASGNRVTVIGGYPSC